MPGSDQVTGDALERLAEAEREIERLKMRVEEIEKRFRDTEG